MLIFSPALSANPAYRPVIHDSYHETYGLGDVGPDSGSFVAQSLACKGAVSHRYSVSMKVIVIGTKHLLLAQLREKLAS